MTTNPMMQSLKDTLEVHCAAYETLCQLLVAQREALISGDADAIHSLVQGQEAILSQVLEAEARRETVHGQMAASAGLDAAASLSEVLSALGVEHAERAELDQLVIRLQALTREAETYNADNGRLVEHALQWIDHSFSEIQTLVTQPGTYQKEAPRSKTSASILMDRSI